ncbi:MAG TPA: FAD-binding oxidoreductase [Usitatibacter sp.]|nr:FAD-binding oxidoreductase [Usitatibacter sp.]
MEPDRKTAAVAIIGGGVLGCSIAWHLAKGGERDVVVLERNEVGSGATARSAGLVSRGRLHRETLKLVRRTREAIAELEAALGEPVGFHKVGSVRAATSPERQAELAAMDALLREDGVAVKNIDAKEALERLPWLDASTAGHISYVEDDGYVDAYQLASAYARAARELGVTIRRGVSVERIVHDGTRVLGLETGAGRIDAPVVVDAGGAWAIGIAASLGVALGTTPVRSHYYITAPAPLTRRDHPVVYLPDARAYARPEVGGLLLGVQEPQSRTYDARTLPPDIADFPLSAAEDDWDVLLDNAPVLREYIPRLDDLPLAHHITGLSTYTPDGKFILGRAGEVEGFFVAGGCCGTGVSASGGIGDSVASLVLGREPAVDLTAFRPERFGVFDPYSEEFRARCAAARAGKSRRI